MSLTLWFSLVFITSLSRESLSNYVRQGDVQYRLPTDTRPETYDVYISTNIHDGNNSFEGSVSIGLVVVSETNSITLHHRELTIRSIRLWNGTVPISLETATHNNISDLLTIPLSPGTTLEPDRRYTLNIEFNGNLQLDQPRGFYRSSYIDDFGDVRYIATTQFGLTDARRGFPCYDEPSFRANFTISICHGSTYSAISNMPSNGEPVDNFNGTYTTTFLTTPPSPAYIIAYTISDYVFKSNEDSTSGSIPLRTYARANAIEGAVYSVDIGEKILMKYNEYFGIDFALPKMDQVAVADFPFSAMENWGMVVYREPVLLLFPNSTAATKTRVSTIIAHEFGHQWFGDLVTPKWWTYAWLSEGFATLFASIATDWVLPEWKIMDYFVYDTLQNVFQHDAEDINRPMSFYIESQADILGVFDLVTYDKASCVLRMIMHAITEDIFKKGLINYLIAHKYEAVDEDDLFNGIAQSILESDRSATIPNITSVMSSWTQQKGYPYLTVSRNYFTGGITIRQERYQSYIPPQTDATLWWIPYNLASSSSYDFSNTSAHGWLSNQQRSITISQSAVLPWTADDWIIFNKQETGYYRVLYDYDNYKLIAKELNEGNLTKIHLVSRSQLIDDAFNFAKTGRLNYSVVFDLISYLKNEKEFVPWAAAFRGMDFVHRMTAATDTYHLLKNFTLILVDQLFEYVGIRDLVENEPHFHKELRILATNWACRMGSEDCLQATNTELRQHMNDLHPNMRQTIYCNGLRVGTDADFATLKSLLDTTVDLNERNLILTALGCSSNQRILTDFIQNSINGTSQSENYRIFTAVLTNGQLGLNVAVQFLQNNLLEAAPAYGATNMINAFIAIASNIVTNDIEDKFIEIIEMATTNGIITDETAARSRNIMQENTDWIINYQESVGNWLKDYHQTKENNAVSTSLSLFLILVSIGLGIFF